MRKPDAYSIGLKNTRIPRGLRGDRNLWILFSVVGSALLVSLATASLVTHTHTLRLGNNVTLGVVSDGTAAVSPPRRCPDRRRAYNARTHVSDLLEPAASLAIAEPMPLKNATRIRCIRIICEIEIRNKKKKKIN